MIKDIESDNSSSNNVLATFRQTDIQIDISKIIKKIMHVVVSEVTSRGHNSNNKIAYSLKYILANNLRSV